ncbi:hypothetical protein BCR32DRAFT_291057 [Anaeromyces robustus]|uniref:Carbohydrate esterase 2 N-terminal domain-containing protein n=1 Tax=Anaeromyces robustus TaxID=1754192 RepID=A0A1Y1XGN5_9FUNG|nr:hypothetical protein BCR32DRAFT_291057 [Anaeromyces robustus]|eukprot:ORX84897.1 hypothetical protein BCR32DRAFT_291057 [Anaeromyces robustus]
MKFNLLFLAAIGAVSALPKVHNKSNNPYLVCDTFDYKCKGEQTKLCYEDFNKCLRGIKCISDLHKCNKITRLCTEIMISNFFYRPESESESEDENGLRAFEPTKENVKVLGRANYQDGYLWFALTNAGIEYKFTGKTTVINVTGDTTSYGEENPARIKIYADNKLYLDTILTEKDTDFTVNFDKAGSHVVTFLKVSEAERGSIRINEIKADAKKIKPTEDAAKKIEFIGDSITCAYGVDGVVGDVFSTRSEDGTLSYAYKTAQKFHADVSMVAYSGFAILSCYAFTGERFTEAALPQYYDKLGYSFEPNEFDDGVAQLQNTFWDYREFIPDLVVINLGTNDNSYFLSIDESKVPDEKVAFIEEYEKFLAQIRANYPNAEILCVLGMMGQEVYPEIEQAVKNYTSKTGDKHVNAFKMNVQNTEENGLAVDGHPAAQSHVDATYELVGEIERLYGWKSDPKVNIELDAE